MARCRPGLAQKGLIVEISARTVVAGWMGVLAAFSVASGAREWTRVIGGAPVLENFENYVVKDIAVTGTKTYVVAGEVFPSTMKLPRVDTASGKVRREITLSKRVSGRPQLHRSPHDHHMDTRRPAQRPGFLRLPSRCRGREQVQPATVPVTLGRPPPSPIRGMTGLHPAAGLR